MERADLPLVILAVATVAFVACLIGMSGSAQAAEYGVDLQLQEPGDLKTHAPPAPIVFNLTVEHTGTKATEDVVVEVLNEPEGWSHNLMATTQLGVYVGNDDVEFQLAKGEVATLTVTLVPKEGMEAGTYWLTINGRVVGTTGAVDSVDVGVNIPRVVNFEVLVWGGPPDGVFKAVPPTTVTVKYVIYNKGNADDRFLVTVESSMWEAGWVPVIVSGADGLGWTPVLEPDPTAQSPHMVTVEVTMPATAIAGTQCSVMAEVMAEADPSVVKSPAGAILKALQHYEFRVRILGPAQKVGHVGETVDFRLLIENLGNGPDTFRIFAAWDEEHAPGWSARPIPSEVEIGAYENGTVIYSVRVPTNASQVRQAFHAEIWSSNTELASMSRTFYVEVAPHYDLVVWADETEATTDPGGSVSIDVHVRNIGNALDSFNLSWVEWEEGWIYYMIPDSVSANPGQQGVVNVTIRVPTDLGASPLPTYTFDLRVESVRGDAEELLALSVHIRPFGRAEWMWDGNPVTSPDEPVAGEGTVRPKPVIDVYNTTTAALSIFVRNTGNIEDNVTFWAWSADDRITVTLLPEWRLVPAWQTVEVFVQISVPDTMFPGEHRVWVNASSSDERQEMRAVPVEFDVIPYYDTRDFANLRWDDPLEDDFEYAYSLEGNEVVSSRGRRGRHSDLDVVSLTGVLDIEAGNVTFTLELKGSPSQERGIFYGVYVVTNAHMMEGSLEDPASHEKGDFVWESHDEVETIAFVYLSDQQRGSSVPMPSLDIRVLSDRVVFTVNAKDLRTAGVDPGSGFRLYAYCHRLGSEDGDDIPTTLVYDTAGQGSVTSPWEFTNEEEGASTFMWIGVAVAIVAILAVVFVLVLPRLAPPLPKEEPEETDEWVEYQ